MPERGWSVPAYRGRSRVLGLGYILSVHSKMKIPTQHLPFCSRRKGEGAFRLQPRELELRSQPLDKYQLRETKRRLQQGLDSSQQSLLGLRACSHLSPLRRDPFCGEHTPVL